MQIWRGRWLQPSFGSVSFPIGAVWWDHQSIRVGHYFSLYCSNTGITFLTHAPTRKDLQRKLANDGNDSGSVARTTLDSPQTPETPEILESAAYRKYTLDLLHNAQPRPEVETPCELPETFES